MVGLIVTFELKLNPLGSIFLVSKEAFDLLEIQDN